jgi:transposase
MGRSGTKPAPREKRRRFDEGFKQEAVQMLVDGHSASDVASRLGLSGPTLLYRWKKELLGRSGGVAASLEDRVRQLEAELARVERERDILKKALGILSRSG